MLSYVSSCVNMPAASFHSFLPSLGGFFWAAFFFAYIDFQYHGKHFQAKRFREMAAATLEKRGKRQ
jgi:hypothetical protein